MVLAAPRNGGVGKKEDIPDTRLSIVVVTGIICVTIATEKEIWCCAGVREAHVNSAGKITTNSFYCSPVGLMGVVGELGNPAYCKSNIGSGNNHGIHETANCFTIRYGRGKGGSSGPRLAWSGK